jgi:hypothetical protein
MTPCERTEKGVFYLATTAWFRRVFAALHRYKHQCVLARRVGFPRIVRGHQYGFCLGREDMIGGPTVMIHARGNTHTS